MYAASDAEDRAAEPSLEGALGYRRAVVTRYKVGMSSTFPDGTVLRDDNLKLTLTQGQEFIASLEN